MPHVERDNSSLISKHWIWKRGLQIENILEPYFYPKTWIKVDWINYRNLVCQQLFSLGLILIKKKKNEIHNKDGNIWILIIFVTLHLQFYINFSFKFCFKVGKKKKDLICCKIFKNSSTDTWLQNAEPWIYTQTIPKGPVLFTGQVAMVMLQW